MSRSISDGHDQRARVWCLADRGQAAAKHPIMHKAAPTLQNYLVQNANSAKVEKHFLIHFTDLHFLVYKV